MIETLRHSRRAAPHAAPAAQRGLSLIELMVAMLLGLLVSAGIVALFSATSQTSRVQTAMSRIQENGRFAMSRVEADLRMAGAIFRQSTAASSKSWTRAAESALLSRNTIQVNASPNPAMPPTGNPVLRDLGTETGRLAEWPAPAMYPLSASFFVRGYECSTGTCVPAVPSGANGIPAAGAAVGNRVVGSDVLTVKYTRGTGWLYTVTSPVNSSGYNVTLAVDTTSGDGTFNFANDDLVLLSQCGSSPPMLFQATVAGNVLTAKAGTLLDATKFKPTNGDLTCDARVFNFTRDFVTVSYWLQLVADPNPGATAGRLIPTLMRSENGVAQELVQGVERLDFLYGAAMQTNGGLAYLTANQVSSNSNLANCPKPSPAFESGVGVNIDIWREPDCLWRALRSIEAHALFNTVDDVGAMATQDMAYWYSVDGGTGPAAPGTSMPVTGLAPGRMMRREFVSLVSIRNGSN
ncbi:PilW family protein [Tahibacter caeni]|uniref:PilW family protein n=1 Tax=Tahibacter caeni TaxID=1453545 RepID=UPI002147B45E|nr:PilW family protein [Tahibacter caeni]